MDRFVVISGCSSSGKSSLLAELGRRGYAFVEEPGRRIVKEELELGGSALPWMDRAAFARRCIALALSDFRAARRQEGKWVFFDRGLIDASVALEHLTGEPTLEALRRSHRFYRRVFLAPPWPEIYVLDRERRHSLETALIEYSRLLGTYPSLGYETIILPQVSVAERADFVLYTLAE
jgi:predicted ATPase